MEDVMAEFQTCDIQRGHAKRDHNNESLYNQISLLKVSLVDSFKHFPDSRGMQITS